MVLVDEMTRVSRESECELTIDPTKEPNEKRNDPNPLETLQTPNADARRCLFLEDISFDLSKTS